MLSSVTPKWRQPSQNSTAKTIHPPSSPGRPATADGRPPFGDERFSVDSRFVSVVRYHSKAA